MLYQKRLSNLTGERRMVNAKKIESESLNRMRIKSSWTMVTKKSFKRTDSSQKWIIVDIKDQVEFDTLQSSLQSQIDGGDKIKI